MDLELIIHPLKWFYGLLTNTNLSRDNIFDLNGNQNHEFESLKLQ